MDGRITPTLCPLTPVAESLGVGSPSNWVCNGTIRLFFYLAPYKLHLVAATKQAQCVTVGSWSSAIPCVIFACNLTRICALETRYAEHASTRIMVHPCGYGVDFFSPSFLHLIFRSRRILACPTMKKFLHLFLAAPVRHLRLDTVSDLKELISMPRNRALVNEPALTHEYCLQWLKQEKADRYAYENLPSYAPIMKSLFGTLASGTSDDCRIACLGPFIQFSAPLPKLMEQTLFSYRWPVMIQIILYASTISLGNQDVGWNC